MTPRRPARSLLARLIVAYLAPTVILFGGFSWFVHRVTSRSLEETLGRRLTDIAQAATTQVRDRAVLFLGPGDDASRTARRLHAKLLELKHSTHAARIMILDQELRSRADTQQGVRIGDHYYHAEADRTELRQVFAGKAASSVLFIGADGRSYKTGYAPVSTADGKIIAAVAVEGSAEFFTVLSQLQKTLLLSGAFLMVLIILLSIVVARRITRPLSRLARAAQRIGGGDLARPILADSRDEVGLLASTMNAMREGLFQRDQNMQMMLAGIAHEVRNPLGGIELFAGLLREELSTTPDDAGKLAHVERIERELHYLKRVVNEFLDFARRRDPDKAPLHTGELITEIGELLATQAREAEVTVHCEPGADQTIVADRAQLRRALLNLAQNGIQAAPRQSPLTISCQATSQAVEFRVSDRGPGIAEDDLPRIFAPFFTTRERGTGLGLSFAKAIAENHGGTLDVESTRGAGATFILSLPRNREDGDNPTDRR